MGARRSIPLDLSPDGGIRDACRRGCRSRLRLQGARGMRAICDGLGLRLRVRLRCAGLARAFGGCVSFPSRVGKELEHSLGSQG